MMQIVFSVCSNFELILTLLSHGQKYANNNFKMMKQLKLAIETPMKEKENQNVSLHHDF